MNFNSSFSLPYAPDDSFRQGPNASHARMIIDEASQSIDVLDSKADNLGHTLRASMRFNAPFESLVKAHEQSVINSPTNASMDPDYVLQGKNTSNMNVHVATNEFLQIHSSNLTHPDRQRQISNSGHPNSSIPSFRLEHS